MQLQSRTAREKAKRAAKEAERSSGNGNATKLSPSGIAGPQKLGNLMAQIQQIRAAAEAGDPGSMQIEGTRPKNNAHATATPSTQPTAQQTVAPTVAASARANAPSQQPITMQPDANSPTDMLQDDELPPLPIVDDTPQPAPPLAQILNQPIQPVEPEGLIIHHDEPSVSSTPTNSQQTQSGVQGATASSTPKPKRRRRRKKSSKPTTNSSTAKQQ